MAPSRCPVASRILIARGKSSRRSPTRRGPSGACASSGSPRRKPTSTAGTPAGPTRASTAPPSAKSRPCSPRSGRPCCRCRWSRSATTTSARVRSISTAASKSSMPTTPHRPAGSVMTCRSNGTACTSASSTPPPALSCASIAAPRPGATPCTPPITLTLLAQAARAGAHIGTLCDTIHRRDGPLGVRRILGVLGLVKKHGPAVVEDACAAALELQVADYRFVRRYLERHPAVPLTLRQVDPLIRELTHYRDVIAQKTQEEEIPR